MAVTQTAVPQVPHWVRPPRGLAKINVDVAMSKNSCQAAATEDGNYLGASVLVMAGQSDPRGDGGSRMP
jgi:hypothetical protein